jgi:predicted HTH transcriptional regulator
LNRIKEGENLHLDFKFAINDSKKIARTLSAFANTDGGMLLIGVKDNGKIAGIRSEEEFYMVQSASEIFNIPPIEFNSIKHHIEGKQVLEVIVNKSENRPHSAPDEYGKMCVYVRVGDQNFKANRILMRVWKKEKSGIGVKISYNKAEKFLLEYLNENPSITFSKFRKSAGIKASYAEKILIDFIVLKMIEITFSDKQISYKLINQT